MADEKSRTWDEQVTIEMDCKEPRNGVPGFGPERAWLRGCLRKDRLLPIEAASEDITQMPAVIPGMRITLNGRTREGRIWDPLASPEFADLLEQLGRIQNRVMRVPEQYKQRIGPEKEVTRKLNETQFKTWLHEMHKMVSAGQAVVVAGTMPKLDTICGLPGKTETELWAQRGGDQRRYLEDAPRAEPALI
jgi:hypothetical protein